jgi:spore maturation protein CgeB
MTTSLLYFGPQWAGSTSLQRLHAFQRLEDVTAIGVDNGAQVAGKASLWFRVRWKLRLPIDVLEENKRLIEAVATHRPDIVLVDNSKVIRRKTLNTLRQLDVSRMVYYSPDDIAARHNLSLPLKWSLPDWDIVCTTKTFNIPELAALGARRSFLVGKAYDPTLHRPMVAAEVGPDYERFDAVFIGTYERERCASINALCEAGVSVAVYGSDKGGWRRERLHPRIYLRKSVFAEEYVRAWHTGKVALCFLRKINRDRITQRTMEIAAIGRPMVAERTDEHDQHFDSGAEYLGFSSDIELVQQVRSLLDNNFQRLRIAEACRRRCLESGYSTQDRARQMIAAFLAS